MKTAKATLSATVSAIVIGAGLLAGSVMVGGPAAAGDFGKRYVVAGDASGSGAWRVDTYTGRVLWCTTETPKATEVRGVTVIRGKGERRVVCYDADGKVDVKLF